MGNKCSTYNQILDDIRKKHLNLNNGMVAKNNELLHYLVSEIETGLANESKLFDRVFRIYIILDHIMMVFV